MDVEMISALNCISRIFFFLAEFHLLLTLSRLEAVQVHTYDYYSYHAAASQCVREGQILAGSPVERAQTPHVGKSDQAEILSIPHLTSHPSFGSFLVPL